MVDNLLEVSEEALQESQIVSNSSARYIFSYSIIIVKYFNSYFLRMLEALETVTASIPIENTSMPVIIPRSSFAVSIQEVNQEIFQIQGQTFTAQLGSSFSENQTINPSDLAFEESMTNSTASINLPNTLFNTDPNATDRRITHSVFLNDRLFQRRTTSNLSVGSIIIAATVVGSSLRDLDPPIEIVFLKNPVKILDNPFFNSIRI